MYMPIPCFRGGLCLFRSFRGDGISRWLWYVLLSFLPENSPEVMQPKRLLIATCPTQLRAMAQSNMDASV